MGVPALFRWLSAKYPKIVERVVETPGVDENGYEIPIDLCDPNPNMMEFDNLYLDMNGIIHPCCHPMDKLAPETEEEMMVEIFKYIDRIFAMIRPRKLLFMAIDGVAPRAKMNQQRSRRFRAAKERREKAQKEIELRAGLLDKGVIEDENEDGDDGVANGHFDYNCITPGTKFMALVSTSIKYYIVDRMNKEPAWKGIKVIFSDANVPGEGEHKIVDYIRRQRLDPDYDANTKHVIYGLDADLIMLSMATHEPYFKVLREDVFYEEQIKYHPCSFCGTKGHASDFCPTRAESDPNFKIPTLTDKPFIFLNVAVLREYLEAELRPSEPLPFKFDLERAIDDWIFMCFFVGNDFLPHLPSLEIREGAIDLLIEIYKANASNMRGYICDNGKVDLRKIQFILNDLGIVEDKIFVKRREKEERRDANIKRRKQLESDQSEIAATKSNPITASNSSIDSEIRPVKGVANDPSEENQHVMKQRRESNVAAAQQLKLQLGLNKKRSLPSDIDDDAPIDNVRLWESGFKERYYLNKFQFAFESEPDILKNLCQAYIEGLCWVMGYYYQGCPSWKWFYPYHYAPFASDLMKYVSYEPITFELGKPFRPFDQLMGVFPADSKELVPEAFRPLMTDSDSEIRDFYPEEFAIDLNGKKQTWQGVVLLPFIEEKRLLDALDKVYPTVNTDELKMNIRGEDKVYFSMEHAATSLLLSELDNGIHSIPLNPAVTNGLAGYVKKDLDFPHIGGTCTSPLLNQGYPEIQNVQVVSFIYFVPYHERIQLKHKASLLSDAKVPPSILTPEDITNIKSGAASRRVPGCLIIDRSNFGGERYGYHSMHQEYNRDYERRENGYVKHEQRSRYERSYEGAQYGQSRGHYERERSPNQKYSRDRDYTNRSEPSSRYPPPQPGQSRHVCYPPPSSNPFNVLAGDLSRAPPAMQPSISSFHRPRYPPPSAPSTSQDIDRLYNSYHKYPPSHQ